MTALSLVACAVCRQTDRPADESDPRVCQECAGSSVADCPTPPDPWLLPCEHCATLVDTNGFDWKLWRQTYIICRPCVEQRPEDYGY